MKVKEIMTKKVMTAQPNTPIAIIAELLWKNHFTGLPVVDNDKLVGFLTSKDILKLQPELFDIFAEKYEIREQNRKLQDEDPLFYGLKKKKR